jgi:phage terminase large subunit-like protein
LTDNAKVARLYSCQHLFEERMVWAPDRPWAEAVITQCATVPNAVHDDLADTTSQALKYLRDIGLLIRGEERLVALQESMKHKGRPPPPLYPGSA